MQTPCTSGSFRYASPTERSRESASGCTSLAIGTAGATRRSTRASPRFQRGTVTASLNHGACTIAPRSPTPVPYPAERYESTMSPPIECAKMKSGGASPGPSSRLSQRRNASTSRR